MFLRNRIVTQATVVCSKACMEQLTSSAAAIEILWDLFSVSVLELFKWEALKVLLHVLYDFYDMGHFRE